MDTVNITVNGKPGRHSVEPRLLLVHYLRDVLGLTGTHVGCDTSDCGACTVLVDGLAVRSCTFFAVQADGSTVETVEGLRDGADLHPVQAAFLAEHGVQCGFCTPGILMTTVVFLTEYPDPDEASVRKALDGHLCRCTGYDNIVKAVLLAARNLRARDRQSSDRQSSDRSSDQSSESANQPEAS